MSNQITRRRLLRDGVTSLGTLAAGGYWSATPLRASRRPSERLRIAAIGVGNRGASNVLGVQQEEIAVLCDVDETFLARMQQRFPAAKATFDLLDALDQPDLDAAVISTPDHTHYLAASTALRGGLHVYCEKPLTRTLQEAAQLAALSRKAESVTQLGNQHHNSDGYRQAIACVQAGRLGEVHEVHCWTNRPLWPQGIPRPEETPPVPAGLHWDLWLRPAPSRSYHPIYHPRGWRGWRDFGSGALGDMGPHLLDPIVMALDLARPETIEAQATGVAGDSFPVAAEIRFTFPARQSSGGQTLPPCKLIWYDGDRQPPQAITRVSRLPADGTLFLGSKARLFVPDYGAQPMLFDVTGENLQSFRPRPLAPAPDHYTEWIVACKTGSTTSCDFDYGARLTSICLLGNQALPRR